MIPIIAFRQDAYKVWCQVLAVGIKPIIDDGYNGALPGDVLLPHSRYVDIVPRLESIMLFTSAVVEYNKN